MGIEVLLIEDDPDAARHVEEAIREADSSFEVTVARSGRDGLEVLKLRRIDCVVLDYRLPDTTGLECLRRIRELDHHLPVVLLTGEGSEDVAVEAWKAGASDYLVKQGIYLPRVGLALQEALGHRELARARASEGAAESRRSEARAAELLAIARSRGIVGESPVLLQALDLAARAARSKQTVLLTGETGTGKEAFASLIHVSSPRSGGPFIVENCSTIPEALLESELFGYERGAFTGAQRPHRGLIETATGGTLFLDEVGDAPLETQKKLLRVLQDRKIRPVGSNQTREVDVRFVFATHVDLEASTRTQGFRSDLLFRIQTCTIHLPPLRERGADVVALARYFLERATAEEKVEVAGFAPETLTIFEQFDWPGNVRQLENVIRGMIVWADAGDVLGPQQVPAEIRRALKRRTPEERTLAEIVREVEIATIRERLRRFGGRRARTAKSLGIGRVKLWKKIRDYRLAPGEDGPEPDESDDG
jgi:two-component system, NtrC family, response regulator AtoC